MSVSVLVKEMLPLVSMEDMLVVKKDGDNIVPAFGTKTSAAWFLAARMLEVLEVGG